MMLGVASTGSALLAAARHLVDCSPGSALRLTFRDTALLIPLFDVFCLSLLLIGIS